MKVAGKPAQVATRGFWISAPIRIAYHRKDLSSEIVVWRQTGSFAHNAPNSPGLSRPGRLKESALVLWNLSLGTLPFLGGLQCIWGGFQKRRSACPSQSPPSGSSLPSCWILSSRSCPHGAGPPGQPCLNSHIMWMQGSQEDRFSWWFGF